MFFQNPPKKTFLEGQSAHVEATGRFWCHFRFSGFPKRHILGDHSRLKNDFSLPGGAGRSVLDPTLAQTATKMVPRRPETRFSSILDRLSMDCHSICLDFCPHSDTPRPQHETHNLLRTLSETILSVCFLTTLWTNAAKKTHTHTHTHTTHNPTIHETWLPNPRNIFLKPWPGGMRVSD